MKCLATYSDNMLAEDSLYITIYVENVAALYGHKPRSPSISIRQSPHQQQSAVHQARPQSDVASVVLSKISRTNLKWSSSTSCLEFFQQFLSAIRLKLIRISFTKI